MCYSCSGQVTGQPKPAPGAAERAKAATASDFDITFVDYAPGR